MILGADRVGKGTILANTLANTSGNVKVRHFSAPPDRNKPWQQYYDFLRESFEGFRYAICDRGFPETYFYESFRNDLTLDFKDVRYLMEEFRSRFNKFHITIVKRDWQLILPYHISEIQAGIADHASNESLNLDQRYVEYCAYYRTMEKFYRAFPNDVSWIENHDISYTLVKE